MLTSSFALCRVKLLLSLTAVVVSLQFLVFVANQGSFALCRVKLLLSLTAVVVSLQFLVFVANQVVLLQDDVVKDCTTEKIAGIVKDLCASMLQ